MRHYELICVILLHNLNNTIGKINMYTFVLDLHLQDHPSIKRLHQHMHTANHLNLFTEWPRNCCLDKLVKL